MSFTDLATLAQHPLLTTGVGKLEWGTRHLAALERNTTETFSDPTNQILLRAELNPESGYHSFRVATLPDVKGFESHFTHAVADVAKNLHPALDQFAWQLAIDRTGGAEPSDPLGVKFPITDTEDAWNGRAARRTRKQFSPGHESFV